MTRVTFRKIEPRPRLRNLLRPSNPKFPPAAGGIVVFNVGSRHEAWYTVRPVGDWSLPGSAANDCYTCDSWEDVSGVAIVALGCWKRRQALCRSTQ